LFLLNKYYMKSIILNYGIILMIIYPHLLLISILKWFVHYLKLSIFQKISIKMKSIKKKYSFWNIVILTKGQKFLLISYFNFIKFKLKWKENIFMKVLYLLFLKIIKKNFNNFCVQQIRFIILILIKSRKYSFHYWKIIKKIKKYILKTLNYLKSKDKNLQEKFYLNKKFNKN